jgi:hypothetical protein
MSDKYTFQAGLILYGMEGVRGSSPLSSTKKPQV